MKTERLRVELLNKYFNGIKILNNISFQVFSNETLAVIGMNSAGKTSMMNILAGSIGMDSGQIYYNNKPLKNNFPNQYKKWIHVVGQNDVIYYNLTVAENILYTKLPFFCINKKKLEKKAAYYLRLLGSTIPPDVMMSDLTKKEIIIVKLASIMASDTELLLIDEPSLFSSNIDKNFLFRMFRMINKNNISIIFITHNIADVMMIADRVLVLRDGISAGEFDIADCSPEFLLSVMMKTDITPHKRRTVSAPEVHLRINGLSNPAIHNISFTLYKKEILGIFDISGMYKTQLLDLIFGYIPKQNGYIEKNGVQITISSPMHAIKHGFSYTHENKLERNLVENLSVKENISLPSLNRITHLGCIMKKRERCFVDTLLQLICDFAINTDTVISHLSSGYQQIVQLAKCISLSPDILLLDEPLKTIDPISRIKIIELFNNLTCQGTSIIIASSTLQNISLICDRCIILYKGRICGEISADEMQLQKVQSIVYESV